MAAEIPVWFKDQSTSSSVTIKMQSDFNYENKWMGYALFIVYEVHEHENINFRIFDNSDPTLDLKVLHQFVCHFKTNEGGLKQPKVLLTPKVPYVGPIGFWVYIPYAWFLGQSNNLDNWTFIEASITSIPGVEMKKCGACLLYQQDALEFVDTIGQYSLGGETECSSSDLSSTSLSCTISIED